VVEDWVIVDRFANNPLLDKEERVAEWRAV
jgi:hypothetical protein